MPVLDRVVTTDDEIDAAIAQSRVGPHHRAVSAEYLPDTDQIAIRLRDDVEVRLPRLKLQGLRDATPAQLAHVEIEGPGTGLVWPDLDVAHDIPGLVDGIFGTRRYMAQLGRAGGSKTSPAKAAAARKNGAKGGAKKNRDRKKAARGLSSPVDAGR
jgi:hypothetical protein